MSATRANRGVARALASTARRAKGPATTAGAAVGGLAVGTAVGLRLRAPRRPHVLGVPLPRGREVRSGAEQVARTGRRLYKLEADVHALRTQAEERRRQSPIEVVLTALTSRRLPRKT